MHRILTICGSLRRASSNKSLLEATARLAPDGTMIEMYDGMADLPAFNPDIEDDAQPQSVRDFRTALKNADGIIISTPEYVHSLPGSLKNALDWVVGTGELDQKPVTLFNASPRSTYAVAALSEILSVMSGRLIEAASVTLQLQGRGLDADGILADTAMAGALSHGIGALLEEIEAKRAD